MYVYVQSEGFRPEETHDLFTVGFYDPEGNFHSESDWNDREVAAKRVMKLNGGIDEEQLKEEIKEELRNDQNNY